MPLQLKPQITYHIVGWLVFISLPLIFLSGQNGDRFVDVLSSYQYWLFTGCYIVIFYLHSNIILPNFYLQKKITVYIIIIALLFIIILLLQPFGTLIESQKPMFQGRQGFQPPTSSPSQFIKNIPPHPVKQRLDIVGVFILAMILALSFALEIARKWQKSIRDAARAEADKANAELSFLKAQINPHFLFNTLNNIYSLAVIKSDNTADSIMKLSNIMRYVTDEASEDFVPLQDELHCLTDYIELQRLRLGKKVTLNYEIIGEPAYKKITPLILMPFIENVFKYGISNHELSVINIKVVVEELTINLFTANKIFSHKEHAERKGVGIANTVKRLQHLYSNRFLLNIDDSNGEYKVHLTLQ